MFTSEYGSMQMYSHIFLWSALLFTSRCDEIATGIHTSELGFLGSPTVQLPTVTITTTLAYKPTLAPGNSVYSLLGCYSCGSSGSGDGAPFGPGPRTTAVVGSPYKFTAGACLEMCASLSAPDWKASKHYAYAGLRSGSECLCASELTSEASKLSADSCRVACTGDARLSCGGRDAVAVYKVVSDSGEGEGSHSKVDDSDSNGVGTSITMAIPSSAFGVPSALVKATVASQQAQADLDPASVPTSPPGTPGAPASSPTIAAITATFCGAVFLAASLFLCFRAYKRKKQQQQERQGTHMQATVDEPERQRQRPQRALPNPINTATQRGENTAHSGGGRERVVGLRRKQGTRVHVPRGDMDNDSPIVPTTPALESGGRAYHMGLHSRRPTISTPAAVEQDGLYQALMGEIQDGPAVGMAVSSETAMTPSAASSGVQWRDVGNMPLPSPVTPTASVAVRPSRPSSSPRSNAVTTPAGTAQPRNTLGDRAWHRRKLSMPFQPPPSGPPSVPLPPLPSTPPMRPQRSFDTMQLIPSPSPPPSRTPPIVTAKDGDQNRTSRPVTPATRQGPRQGPPPPLELHPKSMYALGGLANHSSPSLPAPQPIPMPAPTPALKESPTLPQSTVEREFNLRHEGGGHNEGPDGEWGQRRARGDNWPISLSSIGTSILFPSEDEEEEETRDQGRKREER
ncbi:hypothetical protein GGS23DRAFT_219029 [Durotheca rogersii]|uniref:uncharacterized protein n=1 Tax=Durotheca rogersii TaxID=419775 RepID=UPI00221EAF57|nr:uncharacterized protein GGS23DRAFT_219029 [Durotheca rogersii]KAI5860658.1 hypothetical protein GGS23DRAFT_219029 [Durotheca rogersii]